MPIGAIAPRVLDLSLVAAQSPDAANVGYWVNTAQVGADFDGDPMRLSYAELLAGQRRFLSLYPRDPAVQAGVLKLHELFALRGGAPLPTPVLGPTLVNQPPAPRSWLDALGVRLPTGAPQPGRAVAYGGVTLTRGDSATGLARLGLPFPTPRPHQLVDASSLELELVDERGARIDGALVGSKIRRELPLAKEKSLLVIELDRAKLPATAHLRWSVRVSLADQRLDLAAPVPLSAYERLPQALVPYVQPAPMIQTAAPEIAAMARRARHGATTLQALVLRTLAEMASIRRTDWENQPADFQNDALSFVRTGFGECTAHANLFAALMRANGVPCRVVNCISRGLGAGQNMHFQNEYFVPAKGWAHVEPQGGELQSPRSDVIETGVVSSELEALGGGGLRDFAGMVPLSTIAMQLDANDAPLPAAERDLQITEGLFVRDSTSEQLNGGRPDIALHGAT